MSCWIRATDSLWPERPEGNSPGLPGTPGYPGASAESLIGRLKGDWNLSTITPQPFQGRSCDLDHHTQGSLRGAALATATLGCYSQAFQAKTPGLPQVGSFLPG